MVVYMETHKTGVLRIGVVTVIITTECAVVPVIEIVVTLDQIALLQSQMYLNVHKVRRENLRLRCYVNDKLYAKLYYQSLQLALQLFHTLRSAA